MDNGVVLVGAAFLILILLLVLGALVLLGGSLLHIFAQSSGLMRLAEGYAAHEEPPGQRLTWQTVQIGPVRYRNCVTVVISPQGLYLAVLPRHPAVLIPWRELGARRETRLYWRRAMELAVGEPRVGVITMYVSLFERMRPYVESGSSSATTQR